MGKSSCKNEPGLLISGSNQAEIKAAAKAQSPSQGQLAQFLLLLLLLLCFKDKKGDQSQKRDLAPFSPGIIFSLLSPRWFKPLRLGCQSKELCGSERMLGLVLIPLSLHFLCFFLPPFVRSTPHSKASCENQTPFHLCWLLGLHLVGLL